MAPSLISADDASPIADAGVESLTFHGFDEAVYSEEGVAGLRQILSGRMFDESFPLFGLQLNNATEAKKAEELGYDPTTLEGRYYSRGSLPSQSEEDRAILPLGLSRVEGTDGRKVSLNCFMCHAGAVNGQVVAGLGSNSILQRRAMKPEDRGKIVRGDNYGQYAVWKMAAQIADPENTGLLTSDEETDLTRLIDETPLPTAQPQPWWLMKYKVTDYWYGDGAPTDAAHFSLNFSIGNERINEHHAEHVEMTARALAFARETQSPIFPGELDAELVQLGSELFHGDRAPENPRTFKTCIECHGEYTRTSPSLDLSTPGSWNVFYRSSEELRDVGTDPSYNDVIQKFEPILEHAAKLELYYEAQGTPELMPHDNPLKGDGYVPPPLVGVWATAPYFHNGSVPTIEAVLNSKLRPEIWVGDKSPHAYDLERVGLKYAELTRAEHDKSAERASASSDGLNRSVVDHTYVYDTKAYGRSNVGHTFGDSLTDLERRAVIEFLKSLSGPDMPGKPHPIEKAELLAKR